MASKDDPIIVQILSDERRPHAIELTPSLLICRFPELKALNSLKEPKNMRRFQAIWCQLRKRELEILKMIQNMTPVTMYHRRCTRRLLPVASEHVCLQPAMMSEDDPVMVHILATVKTQQLCAHERSASLLIGRFPALKGYYKLQHGDNLKLFESFWNGLCKRELEKRKRQEVVSMKQHDPIMIQILSEGGPQALQLEVPALIERFPAVKVHYQLEEPCNKIRFESFWCNLCRQELEKKPPATIPRGCSTTPDNADRLSSLVVVAPR